MIYMRINPTIIFEDLLKNSFYKKKWIPIMSGENTAVFFLKNPELIVKIYKLLDQEKKNPFTTTNYMKLKVHDYSKIGYCNAYRELLLLKMMQSLIKTNICTHYPILIGHQIFNTPCIRCNALLKNKLLKYNLEPKLRKYIELQYLSEVNIAIFKEYINNSFKHIFKKQFNEKFWMVLLFHILYTIYINNSKLKMVNFDLHLNNIYFKKSKSGGYTKYKVNNKTYNVPNIGYTFIIIDYGNTLSSLFKLSDREKKEYKYLQNIHYDVFSFLRNFTLHSIKKYYLVWFHQSNLVSKIKKIDSTIYDKIILDIKNSSYNAQISINKQIQKKLISTVVKNDELFYEIQSKIYLPHNKFNKIIKKYLEYAANIRNVKLLPKLDPGYIINKEFTYWEV